MTRAYVRTRPASSQNEGASAERIAELMGMKWEDLVAEADRNVRTMLATALLRERESGRAVEALSAE